MQTKNYSERGAKAKPLDNIDGQGTTLSNAIGNVLSSMLARTNAYQDPMDANKTFMLSGVRCKSGKAYLLIVEPGRKGLQSTVRQSSGNSWTRQVGDIEYVPLRHLIYFPSHAHSAIIFAERFGRMGSMTFLKTSLIDALRSKLPALNFYVNPLTTLEALETATYKKAVFKAPRRKDASGSLLDFGSRVVIDIGFRGRRFVKDLITGSKTIDSKKVFGILTEEGENAGIRAPLDTQGWDAQLLVEMNNGQPRTFNIGESGPALVYSLSGADLNGKTVSTTSYPSTKEFLGVCQTIMEDIAGQYDVTSADSVPPESDLPDLDGSQFTPWEVTYYDKPKLNRNP